MLINNLTYRAGINEIDDVVGIYPDSHIFDENEKKLFQIIKVAGEAELVRSLAKTAEPPQATCYKHDGQWYELVKNPKFELCYKNGKFESTIRRYIENNDLMVTKSG